VEKKASDGDLCEIRKQCLRKRKCNIESYSFLGYYAV